MGRSPHKLGNIRGKLVRTTSIGAWLIISGLCSSQALAQSIDPVNERVEKPVAATIAPEITNPDKLPTDLMPEELSLPSETEIDQKVDNKSRFLDRNSWDPSILTQSTGLSAASSQASQSTSDIARFDDTRVGKGVLGGDLLSAEDLLNVGNIELPELAPGLAVPPRNDGVINLDTSLRGTLFNSPSDSINASVFKLDLGDRLCLGTAEECQANRIESIDIGYAKNITHGKLDGLNLQLTPRAGLRFDDESKSALVGALVRVGDNLREGSEMKSNTWYFFAGADAEAVTYTPTGVRKLTSGEFHLQDRIIVGDAQAGLGYRMGSADLALTYYKRQAKAENYSYDEDAAALSLTWRR